MAVLSVVAERALHELTLARMTLNGELDAEKLPPVSEAKDEADRRRLVALALIIRLSHLMSDAGRLAEDTERSLYEMAGGWELAHQLPLETEEPKVFGFAAARKAA
jgi:hypothetical protein